MKRKPFIPLSMVQAVYKCRDGGIAPRYWLRRLLSEIV